MIRGGESYEALESFKPVLDDINKLVKQGEIEIAGKSYSLEFFLGGDYKVRQFVEPYLCHVLCTFSICS